MKKKRDWQMKHLVATQDQYALDPNLIDSDLFDARLNMEGVAVRGGYMWPMLLFFNLTYGYGWRVDDSLGTEALAISPSIHSISINYSKQT